MRIHTKLHKTQPHGAIATACCWNDFNHLYTSADEATIDGKCSTIWEWNIDGEPIRKVCETDNYVTDMAFVPVRGNRNSGSGSSLGQGQPFVVAYSDGSMEFMSKAGSRIDRRVEGAARGAVITIRWSNDGSTLATGGEDGSVNLYSRNGMLQSKFASVGEAVMALCWSPNDARLLYTTGSFINIVLQRKVAGKKVQWKAHKGGIIQVDWSPVNDHIVSCGEDRRYRVWDSHGRPIYASRAYDHVITSIRWSPLGDSFSAGFYDRLLLCDEKGWVCDTALGLDNNVQSTVISTDGPTGRGIDSDTAIDNTNGRSALSLASQNKTGSVISQAWSADGTVLVCATGRGKIVFGEIIERSVHCGACFTAEITRPDLVSRIDHGKGRESRQWRKSKGFPKGTRVTQISMKFGVMICAVSGAGVSSGRDDVVGSASLINASSGYSGSGGAIQSEIHLIECANDNTEDQHLYTKHSAIVRGNVSLIVQGSGIIAVVCPQSGSGIFLFDYELKPIAGGSPLKFQTGLSRHRYARSKIAVNRDMVALVKADSPREILWFVKDTNSNVMRLAGTLKHSTEIRQITLSQQGGRTGRFSDDDAGNRNADGSSGSNPAIAGGDAFGALGRTMLVFIDGNSDMYLTSLRRMQERKEHVKLRTMVDCAMWDESTDMLASYGDGKLHCWYYPGVAFLDKDLLPNTVETFDGKHLGATVFNKAGTVITDFSSNLITLRMADGSSKVQSLSPFPAQLHYFCSRNSMWEEAVRLCRLVKDKRLWTTLAQISMLKGHLPTAEVSFAAIEDVARLSFILYVKDVPNTVKKNAELALYHGFLKDAEGMLLQASPSLVYSAIQINVRMFQWKRALEIAVERGNYVDIVLWQRLQYLCRNLTPQEKAKVIKNLGKSGLAKHFPNYEEETLEIYTRYNKEINVSSLDQNTMQEKMNNAQKMEDNQNSSMRNPAGRYNNSSSSNNNSGGGGTFEGKDGENGTSLAGTEPTSSPLGGSENDIDTRSGFVLIKMILSGFLNRHLLVQS